jgi:hypothetical protein
VTAAERAAAVIDLVRREWSGREAVLLINRFDGATRALADEVARSGGTIRAAVAGSRLDEGAFAPPYVWNCADHGITLSRGRFDAWLREPPRELADWLDTVDPDRNCTVLGTSYTDVEGFCGRPVHGWWRPEWALWEDKTRVDELWRRAGVPAPPFAVLPADEPDMAGWFGKLDRGRGVIVAADATRSFLGSSKGLRWVREARDADDALRAFDGITDRVRVAAFMPGTPCSVMGMVLPTGVAVFEPFEIVTLRDEHTDRLVYGGHATWWRADAAARDLMREHTRAAGRALAELADYRGLYSVDGVLGEDGFFATELNPRHVSGLALWAGWQEFPVRLFNRAVQMRLPEFDDVDRQDIEDAFCQVIRANPSYTVRIPVTAPAGRHVRTLPDPVGQTVTYEASPGGVRILDLDPVLDDGMVAPAAAALARALGSPIQSFRDDPLEDRDT